MVKMPQRFLAYPSCLIAYVLCLLLALCTAQMIVEDSQDELSDSPRDLFEGSVLRKLLRFYSRPSSAEEVASREDEPYNNKKRGAAPLSLNQDVWQLADMIQRQPANGRQRQRAKNILERFGKRSVPDDRMQDMLADNVHLLRYRRRQSLGDHA